MAALADLVRPIRNRAVHLRIVPRPENIAQSREILRLISAYGPVEMYRNLRYDRLSTPNTALAIFQTSDAAQKLLKQSPLRFHMETDEDGFPQERPDPVANVASPGAMETSDELPADAAAAQPETRPSFAPEKGAWGLPASQTRSFSTTKRKPMISPYTGARREAQIKVREYEIQVNQATINHRDHINVNPFNGSFDVDSKSAAQEDLAKRVPLPGLSDINIRKQDKPWRVFAWQRERERNTRKPLREMLEQGRNSGGPTG